MLLLTGILPQLKSDPVGDTSTFTSAQVAASGGHTHTSGPALGPGLPRDLPLRPVPLSGTRGIHRLSTTVRAPTGERTTPPHTLEGRGATPQPHARWKGSPPPSLIGTLKLIDWVVERAALPASLKDGLAGGWLVTCQEQKRKGRGDSGPLALTLAEDEKMAKPSLVRGQRTTEPGCQSKT